MDCGKICLYQTISTWYPVAESHKWNLYDSPHQTAESMSQRSKSHPKQSPSHQEILAMPKKNTEVCYQLLDFRGWGSNIAWIDNNTSMATALQIRSVHSRRCWFFTTGIILAAKKKIITSNLKMINACIDKYCPNNKGVDAFCISVN
jgi:hypothetical protein